MSTRDYGCIFKSFYCTANERFAIIAAEPGWPHDRRVDHVGKIYQRGSYFYFAGTDRQVCEGFSGLGDTLFTGYTPEMTADKIYKTARGFNRALQAICGRTYEEMRIWQQEAMSNANV
jgi:hypothetical protein